MRMRHVVPVVVVGVAAAAMLALLWPRGSSVRRPASASTPAVAAATPPVAAAAVTPAAPAPAPPAAGPDPRLVDSGFEGMSNAEMVSRDAVDRAFAQLIVLEVSDSRLQLQRGLKEVVATIYGDTAGATKVLVEAPGITTEHGVSVGDRLSDVLHLHARHSCVLLEDYLDSFADLHRAVRCWVGKKPAHFRYVASLPTLSRDEARTARDIPQSDAELDRWIEQAKPAITAIYWNRDPDEDR